MYTILGAVNDTVAQTETMEAVMQFYADIEPMGYVWVKQSTLEAYLQDEKLNKLAYVLRLMADRGLLIGMWVRREGDGQRIILWRRFGSKSRQYNSRQISSTEVLE